MESGGGSASSPRASTSDRRLQRAAHSHREEWEPAAAASGDGGTGSLWSRYFSLPVLLLVGVTASLVILPLVLPPLPPPPSMLMLVPVAMLVLLLVLAFMPTSSVRAGTGTGPTYM
jgi:hypothetical protein